MYKKLIKPLFDFFFSAVLLITISPIIFSVIIILSIFNNGGIFFIQQRPGLYNKPFKILKFKTMKDLNGEDGLPLPDHQRITKIGKFIRSTSLDEILQLVNVLKGDMSFVGPRPLLMKYLPLYSPEQARRHLVKPGITGWAQVKGRNLLSWNEKFNLDIQYVNEQSFLFDFKILLTTIFKVIKRDGINENLNETMTEFKGND